MLQETLAKLVSDLKRWQQLAQAHPNTLQVEENKRRQAAIAHGLPLLEEALTELQVAAMIAEEVFEFVYQVREELVRTGLATGYGRFIQFIRYVWEYAHRVEGNPLMIKDACDRQRLRFRNTDLTDVKKFVREIEANCQQPLVDHKGDPLNEEEALIERLEADEVQLFYEVALKLAQRDQTVSVVEFHYQLELQALDQPYKWRFNWKQAAQ